ncbi:hypothetical protein, partial [uncultured Desulfovibrio sp.]|uniref:hypothetical protein n=1 Tax=uncultured Desulfovibrio sp. TaxID=167968 RepID=UPI00320B0265
MAAGQRSWPVQSGCGRSAEKAAWLASVPDASPGHCLGLSRPRRMQARFFFSLFPERTSRNLSCDVANATCITRNMSYSSQESENQNAARASPQTAAFGQNIMYGRLCGSNLIKGRSSMSDIIIRNFINGEWQDEVNGKRVPL